MASGPDGDALQEYARYYFTAESIGVSATQAASFIINRDFQNIPTRSHYWQSICCNFAADRLASYEEPSVAGLLKFLIPLIELIN